MVVQTVSLMKTALPRESPRTSMSEGGCPWLWSKRKTRAVKRDGGVLAEFPHTQARAVFRGERCKQKTASDAAGNRA